MASVKENEIKQKIEFLLLNHFLSIVSIIRIILIIILIMVMIVIYQ